jgi:steroid delta-isomerase-like uncharacterized protein
VLVYSLTKKSCLVAACHDLSIEQYVLLKRPLVRVFNMSSKTAESIIRAYYQALNEKDMISFFDLLADDVIHDVNEGVQEQGKTAFRFFMNRVNRNYDEQISELAIMFDESCNKAAAEFMVEGRYLESEFSLPEANGQYYKIKGGTFFELRDNLIVRVTSYYNLAEWVKQVEQTDY